MSIRMNALAAAALLSFSGTGAAQAQSQFPSASSQAMMSQQRMMNQMEMMNRSQQLQAMWRAREAERKRHGSAPKATGKRRPATAKPKVSPGNK